MRRFAALLLTAVLGLPCSAAPGSVFLDELSSPEVREALRAGTRTIIIPVGGTEQNDGAARSFAQHGFTDVVILGDSGNYQGQLEAVAEALNRGWKGGPARAHYIAAYYQATQQPFAARLREHGLSDAQIGSHAGAADTSLMLAVDAARVWPQKVPTSVNGARAAGVSGDPSRASAELGRLGTDLVIRDSVAAIRKATAAPR